MSTSPEMNPDNPSKLHSSQAEAVRTCRDVYEGTLHMRKRTTSYLPRFPKEREDDYSRRVNQAILFNAFKRTVHGLTGMISRNDPTLEVSKLFEDHWMDIDLQGNHGAVFAEQVLVNSLIDGHAHVFVDMQRAPEAMKTLADEKAMNFRPYWTIIKKQQVLRHTAEFINGVHTLTSVAWKEVTCEPVPPFGEEEVERIRIYRLRPEGVTVELWRKVNEEWVIEEHESLMTVSGGKPLDRIPIATIYGERTGFMASTPPLLDLALENIGHYQLRSDRINTLHIAGVPIPVIIGADHGAGDVTGGAGHGIRLDVGGKAEYMEPKGHSLSEAREEQKDQESRMAVLGLAMLKAESRAAETAKAKQLDRSEKDSALRRVARSLQDGFSLAMQHHANWIGDEAGEISVNKDFNGLVIDPQRMAQLSAMVEAGQISIETLWDVLERGELLPDTFDPEVEVERIMNPSVNLAPAVAEGTDFGDE